MKRRLVLAGAAASLSACGFHPVYGPLANGGTVHPELAAIYVAVMAERTGQLLRQALQQRLGGTGEGIAKAYTLSGGISIIGEGYGIQQDTSTTRIRLDARATWQLQRVDPKQTLMTKGTARAVDGYDVNNQQYFATDLEQSSAYQRLAETVADQITLDLALYFRKQAETPSANS